MKYLLVTLFLLVLSNTAQSSGNRLNESHIQLAESIVQAVNSDNLQAFNMLIHKPSSDLMNKVEKEFALWLSDKIVKEQTVSSDYRIDLIDLHNTEIFDEERFYFSHEKPRANAILKILPETLLHHNNMFEFPIVKENDQYLISFPRLKPEYFHLVEEGRKKDEARNKEVKSLLSEMSNQVKNQLIKYLNRNQPRQAKYLLDHFEEYRLLKYEVIRYLERSIPINNNVKFTNQGF